MTHMKIFGKTISPFNSDNTSIIQFFIKAGAVNIVRVLETVKIKVVQGKPATGGFGNALIHKEDFAPSHCERDRLRSLRLANSTT